MDEKNNRFGMIPPRDLRLKMIDKIAEGARNSLADNVPVVMLMLTPDGAILQVAPDNISPDLVAQTIQAAAAVLQSNRKTFKNGK